MSWDDYKIYVYFRMCKERRRALFYSHRCLRPHVDLLQQAELFAPDELVMLLFGRRFTENFINNVTQTEEFQSAMQSAANRMQNNRGYVTMNKHLSLIQFSHYSQVDDLLKTLNLPKVSLPFDFPVFPLITHIGGRISHFVKNWECITSDPVILNMVKGHRINFNVRPENRKGRGARKSKASKNETEAVAKLLVNKVIEHAECEGFVSNLFVVPKASGGLRPILNISKLNKFVTYVHFKLNQIKQALLMVRPHDSFITGDIEKAYDSASIHPEDRKFLQFYCNNQLYQYRGWPNGLSECPRLFTKLLKPFTAALGNMAIRHLLYLDDLLAMHQSADTLRAQASIIVQIWSFLGFSINIEKSVFTPTKEINFLGFRLSSTTMTVSVPTEKMEDLKSRCYYRYRRNRLTKRELASLIGKLQSTSLAVAPGPLFYRGLQNMLITANMLPWESMLTLTAEARQDLKWWIEQAHNWSSSPIHQKEPSSTLTSDASGTGWGAVLQDKTVKGKWTSSEMKDHINIKELKAIKLGLMILAKDITNSCILVQSDNTTALAYIKNRGGTRVTELNKLTREIWMWALQRGIYLKTQFIPGTLNKQADALSRQREDMSDWKLKPEVFRKISERRGPLTVDLFASCWNNQTLKFYSWNHTPAAAGQDAFLQPWPVQGGYAFPPFALVQLVLNRIRLLQTTTVVITPLWKTATWFTDLNTMSIQAPLLLPKSPDLITDQTGRPHPLLPQMRLVAWTVSGKTCSRKVFTQMQLKSWQTHRDQQPREVTDTSTRGLISGAEIEGSLQMQHL